MTPKEKAKELVEKFGLAFGESYGYNKDKAKQCALIVVDEITKEANNYITIGRDNFSNKGYWQQVKEEIEKYEHVYS